MIRLPTIVAALVLCAVFPATATGSEPGDSGLHQYTAAIHVHSSFSNGTYEVEELAALASERGLDVLVLSDSYLTEVVYGLWPLDRTGVPGLNRVVRPGVLNTGAHRYLHEVEEAGRRHPDLVIVPGVEAAPSYRWTGSPWSGLELHDFDRHIQVFGLDAEDLRDLPVIGNERWSNTRVEWPLVILPAALVALGALLLRGRGRAGAKRRRGFWRTGAVLVILGLVWWWNNWPFGTVADPHAAGRETAPHQRLIDWVADRGGITCWSYPEARYPDVPAGGAVMVSRPHPEDLLETDRYHLFEGLYGDRITATLPGHEWDRALLAYLAGERELPPFVVTGIDFHDFRDGVGRWYELNGGLTVLLLQDRSEDAVLDALRTGRGYATFQGYGEKFRLNDFTVCTADGECGTHGQSIRGPAPVAVTVAMDWLDGPPPAGARFDLELVRDGAVVKSERGPLPVEWRIEQDLEPGRHYFRFAADAERLNRVLSNPVFVTVE